MNNSRSLRHLRMAFFLALLIASGLLFGADKGKKKLTEEEKEAAERAAEDQAALEKEKQPAHFHSAFETEIKGRLALDAPDSKGGDKPDNNMLGTFTADSASYIVMVEGDRDTLRARLLQYDNKDVTLQGKIRNHGKYFIVQNIMQNRRANALAPPDERKSSRGL